MHSMNVVRNMGTMFCEEKCTGPHDAGPRKSILNYVDELVCITVLTFNRPDVRLIFFERVDMHHPVKDYRAERSSGCITRFLHGD